MAINIIRTTISDLHRFLNEQGYKAIIQPTTDISPTEQIIISLETELPEKDLVLRIFWSQESDSSSIESEPRFLQFFVLFPFIITESAMKDLTQFIFNLNSSFDMANFGLYEAQRLLYYRYVHIHAPEEIHGEALLAILASIQFLIDMLFPSFMSLASGQKNLAELEKEAKEVLKNEDLDLLLEEEL